MPVIHIYHPEKNKDKKLFKTIAASVCDIFKIPDTSVWIFWNRKKKQSFYKQDWDNNKHPAPALLIQCRESYTEQQIQEAIMALTAIIKASFGCAEKEIFISFLKVKKGDLFSQGNLWIQV
jgi:phenylpyruvate tautomerase PptA (4-oxalocrotonate tautomerase family)